MRLCVFLRHARSHRDSQLTRTPLTTSRGCFTHKQLQPRAGALRHLAVLLGGPIEPGTELCTAHAETHLTGQHEPLIVSQPQRKLAQAGELQTQRHQLLDGNPRVDELDTSAVRTLQRDRVIESCLHRTATAERTLTVEHSREQLLLERVSNVLSARKREFTLGTRQQLQRRLAQAVLQIFPAQPVCMDAQQQLASGLGYQRNLLNLTRTPLGDRRWRLA